jgi:hypothetical protein
MHCPSSINTLIHKHFRTQLCRETISNVRGTIETLLDSYAQSSIAPKFVSSELLPLYRQGVEIVDQIPDLLLAIAQVSR